MAQSETPINPSEPNPSISAGTMAMSPSMVLDWRSTQMTWWQSYGCSVLLHVLVVVLIFLAIFIIKFLGWNILPFQRPEHIQDIEFQLVEAPDEKPTAPTRNRAAHNTRAGGPKSPQLREAQPMKQSGSKASKATRANQAKQAPSKRPTPPKQTRSVAPVPQQPKQSQQEASQQTPTPPKPKATPPKPKSLMPPKPNANPSNLHALPNPLSPIKVPEASSSPGESGPIVKSSGPSGNRSAGGGSRIGPSLGPATMPGQFSGGGGKPSAGSPGGVAGQGGPNGLNQAGSPGGGGGKPGINAKADPNWGAYLSEVQRRIRRNWNPPEDRQSKKVVIYFTIGRDGRLLGVNIVKPSGDSVADSAARSAIERSAPFRPLPPEFSGNQITIDFTFDYKYLNSQMGSFRRN